MSEKINYTPPGERKSDSGLEKDPEIAQEMAKSADELQTYRANLRAKGGFEAAESLEAEADSLYEVGRGRGIKEKEEKAKAEIGRQQQIEEENARQDRIMRERQQERTKELVEVGKIVTKIKSMKRGEEIATDQDTGEQVVASFDGWREGSLSNFQHWFPRYEFPDKPMVPANIRVASISSPEGASRLWTFTSSKGTHFLVGG
jgi:hypothetical protein